LAEKFFQLPELLIIMIIICWG